MSGSLKGSHSKSRGPPPRSHTSAWLRCEQKEHQEDCVQLSEERSDYRPSTLFGTKERETMGRSEGLQAENHSIFDSLPSGKAYSAYPKNWPFRCHPKYSSFHKIISH